MTAVLILVPLLCSAQGKIFTKKARLEDFPSKTTVVVMSGDTVLDESLRQEVLARWRVSPFEFCGTEVFDQRKIDASYYFLMFTEDGAGMTYLTLVKGGRADSRETRDALFEVITVPVKASGYSTGREFVYLSAIIDVIQQYVEDAMSVEGRGFIGLSQYNFSLPGARGHTLYIAESDLCDESVASFVSDKMVVCSEKEADRLFVEGGDYLVGFTIEPSSPTFLARTFRFIVSADTHELYYFKSRRYFSPSDKGFGKADIKALRKFVK